MEPLAGIVSRQLLQGIIDSFFKATGLRPSVVDLEGRVQVVPSQFPQDARFCRLIHQACQGREKCQGSYARAGYYAAKLGEPYIFRCHAGLVGWAAPLIVGSAHLGSIVCSQVLMWEPDDFFWVELGEMTKTLGVAVPSLIEAAKELPIISTERAQAGAELLFAVGSYLAQTEFTLLEQERKIARQQALLGEEIRYRKTLERLVRSERKCSAAIAIFKDEHELLAKIKKGALEDARQALNRVLAGIVADYGGSLPVLKTRIQELTVLMVRAIFECGGDAPRLLALNHRLLTAMSEASSIESATFLVTKGLELLFRERMQAPVGSQTWVIRRAIKFMRENYQKPLTLDQVADAAYVSKYHLCHLFKKHLGCTVLDYLRYMRVDEAKRMFSEGMNSLEEVARRVGFADPSHFCKTFRKKEGMTPGQFVKRNSR